MLGDLKIYYRNSNKMTDSFEAMEENENGRKWIDFCEERYVYE